MERKYVSTGKILKTLKQLIARLEAELTKKEVEYAYLQAQLAEIVNDYAEFRDFVDDSARHIRRLIITYGRRLQVLEIQQALKGTDAPAELILEIQDIRLELEKLYAEMRASETRPDKLKGRDNE